MTTEEFNKQLAAIPDSDLIEVCHNEICELAATYGNSLHMSIPPREYDTDIVLTELVRRYKATLSLPNADNGGAEEIAKDIFGLCQCDTIYRVRAKTDPNCMVCNYGDDITNAMQTFAAQEVAKAVKEKDAEIEELKISRGEVANEMVRRIQQVDKLQSELIEAKQRIEELEKELELTRQDLHTSSSQKF